MNWKMAATGLLGAASGIALLLLATNTIAMSPVLGIVLSISAGMGLAAAYLAARDIYNYG